MRIVVVSDAWKPQVNGVVRTLGVLGEQLHALGETVRYVTPDAFRTIPCPTYPEIRLAVAGRGAVARAIDSHEPDAVHIATEGPLGWAARGIMLRRGLPFSTSFHTQFPEYIHARTRLPLALSYPVVRRFHAPASSVMVPSRSVKTRLEQRGFRRVRHWSRGVDTDLFRPEPAVELPFPRPIMLYVGRIAVEKNLEAFLKLDLPGTKVLVGEGPQRDALRRAFPEARFLGAKFGAELAAHFAGADVFVFPSRTDTFGLVLLEAMACGVPVAAFPVQGPCDVVGDSGAGALDEDLGAAIVRALAIPRADARAYALTFSWRRCAEQFRMFIHPFEGPPPGED